MIWIVHFIFRCLSKIFISRTTEQTSKYIVEYVEKIEFGFKSKQFLVLNSQNNINMK